MVVYVSFSNYCVVHVWCSSDRVDDDVYQLVLVMCFFLRASSAVVLLFQADTVIRDDVHFGTWYEVQEFWASRRCFTEGVECEVFARQV